MYENYHFSLTTFFNILQLRNLFRLVLYKLCSINSEVRGREEKVEVELRIKSVAFQNCSSVEINVCNIYKKLHLHKKGSVKFLFFRGLSRTTSLRAWFKFNVDVSKSLKLLISLGFKSCIHNIKLTLESNISC